MGLVAAGIATYFVKGNGEHAFYFILGGLIALSGTVTMAKGDKFSIFD